MSSPPYLIEVQQEDINKVLTILKDNNMLDMIKVTTVLGDTCDIDEILKQKYVGTNHFRECLERYQAKEEDIPEKLLIALRNYFDKNKIDKIDQELIKVALKNTGYTMYYDKANLILKRIPIIWTPETFMDWDGIEKSYPPDTYNEIRISNTFIQEH